VTVYPQTNLGFILNDTARCLKGNRFEFTDTSKLSSGRNTFRWDFGDNDSIFVRNPSHKYTKDGNYIVRLISTTDQGCLDTIIQDIRVYPRDTAGYALNDPDQCIRGNRFDFYNRTTTHSVSNIYRWDFGDSTFSSATNPSHVYLAVGSYPVRLISETNYGCLDTFIGPMTVYPQSDVKFDIVNDSQCLSGNKFEFKNRTTLSQGSFSSAWDFGDGNFSVDTNPGYSYNSAGNYTVRLVTRTNQGCLDSVSAFVKVFPQPVISISVNDSVQCLIDNNFVFKDSTTIASGTLSYLWRFGDGAMSSLQNPNHTYSYDGIYITDFIATSDFGCRESISKILRVDPNPEKPIIRKSGNALFIASKDKVQWFLKGTVVKDADSSLFYPTKDGDYTVMVTNEFGCSRLSDTFAFAFHGSKIFGLVVHPNPNDGHFTISTSVPIDRYEVHDINGKLILESEDHLNSRSVNLFLQLAKAEYIVTVFAADEAESAMIVVQ
jgi:PKD repeat protein